MLPVLVLDVTSTTCGHITAPGFSPQEDCCPELLVHSQGRPGRRVGWRCQAELSGAASGSRRAYERGWQAASATPCRYRWQEGPQQPPALPQCMWKLQGPRPHSFSAVMPAPGVRESQHLTE